MFTTAENDQSSATSSSALAQANAAMTYAQLIEHGSKYLTSEGLGKQQTRNMTSALRLWLRTHGFQPTKVIAEEFGEGFDSAFSRFCDAIAETLGSRTQRDRQEQLLRWRRIAEALRHHDTLPAPFAEALEHCLKHSHRPRRKIAREAGVPLTTLGSWSSGTSMPRGETVHAVGRLEEVLELPQGALAGRLPARRRTRYGRNGEKPDRSCSYSKLRKRQLAMASGYAVKFAGRLAAQWQELLQLKTDANREFARARNTWRLKDIDRVGHRTAPSMMLDGQVCATASVHWGMFASYLGWLTLPAPQGVGLPKEDIDTLAWLTMSEHVLSYARWVIRRAGQRLNNGVVVFLQDVESYLRPRTGFLWLRPDLRATLPSALAGHGAADHQAYPEAAWRRHCEQARAKIRDFRVRAIDTMGVRRSRNPEERAAVVLNDEFPLKKLVQFVKALEDSPPPPAHRRDYIAWIRDVVLCKILISNPLRIGQYAAMTYRPDGTGNLRRVGPRRYVLHFEPADFKNEKGAADTPYDVEVDESVVPWIERYLSESRPSLFGAGDTDRFFLPAVAGPRKPRKHLVSLGLEESLGYLGEGLSTRIKLLTATYIDGCPGFGANAFRHIIATDHLKRHPGDYPTVAMLLHDTLETVLKNYAHLKVGDGLRVLSSGIRQATDELKATLERASERAQWSTATRG